MNKSTIPLYISTRRTAQLAKVEPHVILMSLARKGNYRGITPRKGPNGHWIWEAAEVYKALGLFPDSKRPGAKGLQDRVIEATGADVYSAHLVVDWLHETSRIAPTAGDRLAEMFADVVGVLGLVDACRARTGHALNDEGEMSANDWARANALSSALSNSVDSLVSCLRWRSA